MKELANQKGEEIIYLIQRVCAILTEGRGIQATECIVWYGVIFVSNKTKHIHGQYTSVLYNQYIEY